MHEYIYIYICIYIYIYYTRKCIHTYITYIQTYIHYIHYIHIYIHTYINIHHIHTHMRTWTALPAHSCIHIIYTDHTMVGTVETGETLINVSQHYSQSFLYSLIDRTHTYPRIHAYISYIRTTRWSRVALVFSLLGFNYGSGRQIDLGWFGLLKIN